MADDDDPISMTDLAGLLAPLPKEGDNEGDGASAANGQADPPSGGADDDNPDLAGTGADEPEAGEGEGQDADETEELSTEPSYTVKIDGKDHSISLKEALAGYQRQSDYTRRTQEVADARRAIETEQAQTRQARDQYLQSLNLILERLGPENGELNAEQWNTLRQRDPVTYAAEWTDYQRRETQRNAVKLEQARVNDERRGETVNQVRTFVNGEREKLVRAIPVLADPEKGPAEMRAMREYAAKTFNFSDAELDQAYDHRMLLMLDKARKWDAHQTSLAKARGKIDNAVQVSAPQARQPVKTGKVAARKAAQDKFNKSGGTDFDAAALLLIGN
jgi:hypothetical protein